MYGDADADEMAPTKIGRHAGTSACDGPEERHLDVEDAALILPQSFEIESGKMEPTSPQMKISTKETRDTKETPKWLAYTALVLLTVQNSSAVLVMRYTRAVPEESKYLPQTAVIMQELLKGVTSAALILREHGTLSTTFLDRGELLKSGVPAFLYLVQNNLQYLAVSYLQAATFQVTYQLKILSTALLSVVILGKRLELHQWGALVLLTLGVIVVQLSEMSNSAGTSESSNLPLGLAFTLAATLSSGLAGVYFEKILKGTSKLDLWQRNLQLGLYSVAIGLVGLVTTGEWEKIAADGFFQGYTGTTVASIHLQGLGGLLIAIVIKYTDNIMKNIATSMAIVLSATISVFLFGAPFTLLFFTGAMMVNAAAYWYSR